MTKTAVKTVGVVGAGRMGTPIIGHLARKGFATRACDLNAARAGAVKKLGAQWAASPEALAAESTWTISVPCPDWEIPMTSVPPSRGLASYRV